MTGTNFENDLIYLRCTSCGEDKPATTEFFHAASDKHKHGLQPSCKSCRAKARKIYYQSRREEFRAEGRVRAEKNRTKNTERMRLWRIANPQKHLNWQKQYWEEYRKNPQLRLHRSVSEAIRRALRGSKNGRPIEDVLGYTTEALTAHIEKQFVEGMSWANYGKWHIDHILPRSMFSFVTEQDPDFRMCWAMSNLRPLWSEENIKKSARRTLLI
jgi:hypothetical protein